ncbi:MAG: hypothetical protein HOF69_02270 [Campylobacteraceae bacterium]|jgi:hypothetical protein|nr:hypothetical protein [Campylobacteraceae bacterium]MBT3882069.1 hypothetical protein [Campylobacteraceae bacterium]MBT4030928.1 hypothetical protein [Campylobacteraceae bacterium]MBT4179676.1 hypothetical protein [Campylobacteraceae bacterium]MBT4571977.1 hypothetical protein [Campylobacteraceae bacterium]
MEVELKGVKFDLSKIQKYYPAVILQYDDGETTEISFEWLDTNTKPLNEVKVLHYILVIYTDISNGEKVEIIFENRDELFEVIHEIGIVLDRLKQIDN